MKGKQLLVSFLALCLLGAYYFFFEVKKKDEDEKAKKQKETIFPGLDREKISQVRLFGSNGEIVLKKENGSWFMDRPLRAPADAAFIGELTGKLSTDTYRDKLENAAFPEYGLVTPSAGVALTTDPDGKKYEMDFGIPTTTGENVYGSIQGNTSTVFIVSGILKAEADKKIFDWRDKRVMGNVDTPAVTGVIFGLKDKKYRLVKDAGGWSVVSGGAAEKARGDRIAGLIDNLRTAQAKSIEDATAANLSARKLASPAEYITFMEGTAEKKFYFGAYDKKNNTVFCRGDYQDGIFELPDFFIKNIQKADAFVDKRIAAVEEKDILGLNVKYAGRQFTAAKTVKKDAPPEWNINSMSNISGKEKSLISPTSVSYALVNLEYAQKLDAKNPAVAGQDYGFTGGCEITAYGEKNTRLFTIVTGKKLADKDEIYVKNMDTGGLFTTGSKFMTSINLPGLEVK
jgi:hypothetical protein